MTAIEPGVIVDDRFEILAPLDRGGIGGRVYHARQQVSDRDVALKILQFETSDAEAITRIHREALALSRLNHRNIVSFYAFNVWNGLPYIAMEFVNGSNLETVVKQEGPLNLDLAISIAIQLCEALKQAHGQGIVHRDLKPSSILLVNENGQDVAKVVDFGLVRILLDLGPQLAELTQTGTILGSPMYISPEQCSGSKVDSRTDLYSVGAILHFLLTAQAPFAADSSTDLMELKMNELPKPLTAVCPDEVFPAGLQSVIYKCMARSLDDRYQYADDVIRQLRMVQNGQGNQITSFMQAVDAGRLAGRLSKKMLVPMAIVAAAVTSAMFFLTQAQPPSSVQATRLVSTKEPLSSRELFKELKFHDIADPKSAKFSECMHSDLQLQDQILQAASKDHLLGQAELKDVFKYRIFTYLRMSKCKAAKAAYDQLLTDPRMNSALTSCERSELKHVFEVLDKRAVKPQSEKI
jgi:serine/threonine protein kinase